MHVFAGIAALNGNSLAQDDERRFLRAVGARRGAGIRAHRVSNAVFAESVTGPQSGSDSASLSGQDGCLFVAYCRLDNRNELADALRITPPDLRDLPDAVLVKRMFQRWGAAGIARCLGAFAFAQWDRNARRLTLARDCLGQRTLFFHSAAGLVLFANTLPGLLALPWVPRRLDELTLADFLAVNSRVSERTFYQDVERVPSRTMVTIDPLGIERKQYWSPSAEPLPFRREDDYVERARELFDQAVAATTDGIGHVAISTSGGLDSSAIAATAARLGRSERITCYSLVPPADYKVDIETTHYRDERPKLQALAGIYPQLELRLLAPERPDEFDDDERRYFARLAQPQFGPVNHDWFGVLERTVAADRHRVLLIGVQGNAGLTWPGRFALSSLLQAGEWSMLAREAVATARENKESVFWTAYAHILKPLAPISVHALIHRLRGRDPHSVARHSLLNPQFISDHRLAQHWQEMEFDPRFGQRALDPRERRAFILFDRNQPSRDHLAMIEETCGLEMRDPHADRRLLEFCLSVPEWMYRANGVPRAFARKVFADRLPPEILRERRLGMQGGAWFRRLKRAEIAEDVESLELSATARRLIDLPRLKRLLNDWPKNEQEAEKRAWEYRYALTRGLHVGRFIRWVEGANR